ncbi:hypothetical protein BFP70_10930 [Thioclava sp. SK-1]|uniref:inositol monophosphatase family protein n=1 Tax=Thioclava sp. SK-1 TaxID=1889770 RepID=UPI0008252502|nr:inositol monophosphatase [Thioclava sp. SK-1]OCX64544.1 hypothetical protein BFP70_10930 [Thioclava sp. SK-1]
MPLTPNLHAALIDITRTAARDQIMPRFRTLTPEDISTKSSPEDLVTQADLAAEAQIARACRALFPDALIIGEEAVENDPSLLAGLAGAARAVIIDPVDGTSNFAQGLATFGVILAVVEHGETIFGLLYDPVLDDWVMAHKGGGAWYCREGAAPRQLGPWPARPAERACGYLSLALFAPDKRAAVAATFPPYARLNTLGCSCHEYRQMALGHAQFMVSPMTKPWDHAAGALIVEECGGQVLNGRGQRWTPATPVAPITARSHHEQAAPILP